MYSSLGNVQVLISLLKKYNIKHIVISPGGRSTPFVHSIEQDDFFHTYSVVDERSASFFAMGLAAELKEPIAVSCSSGTAVSNFVSAACESFYQQLPLLMISADRNHNYLYQQEEQMVPQEKLMEGFSKRIITLRHVRDEKDFWYASRICNEALLELTTGEKGPVHINYIVENDYPINQGIVRFEKETLPNIKRIDRLSLEDSNEKWKSYAEKFKNSKILIVYGQNTPLSDAEIKMIEEFTNKYNCVISTDIISNLHVNHSINTYSICKTLNQEEKNELSPDILITMNANSISMVKNVFAPMKENFQHIHVSSKGEVSDPFKCLPDVIACSPITFFKKFAELGNDNLPEHSYYNLWNKYYQRVGQNGLLNNEELNYSALYVAQQLISKMPNNSLFHIANSMSIRMAAFFEPKEDINVYCNRGTNGIDGSMSAFIGQAHVSGKQSFLLIGDLSFFYDMNALWNKYVGKNVRIVVMNNSGGAIFYNYPGENNIPTIGKHIAAEHTTSIKDWVVSRGFKYLSATNKEEVNSAIEEMVKQDSDSPIILEAFTEKHEDINAFRSILEPYQSKEKETIKQKIWHNIPEGMAKDVIRGLIKKGQ